MVDILHRIGVVAPLDEVYRAVMTPEGLAGWWTIDTAGKSEVGGQLSFRFGGDVSDEPQGTRGDRTRQAGAGRCPDQRLALIADARPVDAGR